MWQNKNKKIQEVSEMAVEHISNADFDNKVLKGRGITIVDFFADWCGPCKMLAPVVEELAAAHPEAHFYKVNVDEEAALALKYQIMSIPTLVLMDQGVFIKRVSGVQQTGDLKKFAGLE